MESQIPPTIPIVHRPEQLPPGQGGLVIPHEDTFSAVFGWVQRQYGHMFDEAARDSLPNAYSMRLDPVIMEPLDTRFRSISLLPWHLEPEDKDNQDEVEAAQATERRMRKLLDIEALFRSLLEADWYGRQGVQIMYDWDVSRFDNRNGIKPTGWVPVEGDKLVFKWDGTVGIRVNPLFNGSKDISDQSMVHWFTPNERQNLIVHRYLQEDAPYSRGEMAGAVQGIGLRHRLYWFWAQKNLFTGLLADFLRWFAQGIIVLRYQAGNAEQLREVTARVTESQGKPYLFWPVHPDSGEKYEPVQVIQPSSASVDFLLRLTTEYYDTVIRRMILGQTATTVQAGEWGGTNGLHGETFAGVVKFSSLLLSATLTRDFVATVHKWSYPGLPTPRHTFDIDVPNVEQMIEGAQFIIGAGGKVNGTALKKAIGLPPVAPGDEELGGGPQAMQPAAVAGMPEGVPVVDAGGEPEQSEQPQAEAVL